MQCLHAGTTHGRISYSLVLAVRRLILAYVNKKRQTDMAVISLNEHRCMLIVGLPWKHCFSWPRIHHRLIYDTDLSTPLRSEIQVFGVLSVCRHASVDLRPWRDTRTIKWSHTDNKNNDRVCWEWVRCLELSFINRGNGDRLKVLTKHFCICGATFSKPRAWSARVMLARTTWGRSTWVLYM